LSERPATIPTNASKIAGSVGIDEKKVYDLLHVDNKPSADGSLNSGNGVTNNLKVLVKYNRKRGIHVTPTVVFNGIEEGSISSGFSGKEWEDWLEKNIV
jgi:hypothetical protein